MSRNSKARRDAKKRREPTTHQRNSAQTRQVDLVELERFDKDVQKTMAYLITSNPSKKMMLEHAIAYHQCLIIDNEAEIIACIGGMAAIDVRSRFTHEHYLPIFDRLVEQQKNKGGAVVLWLERGSVFMTWFEVDSDLKPILSTPSYSIDTERCVCCFPNSFFQN
ncbi:hypothetical protein [Chromatium okenii]|jgi:hypothetical protein|uniref:hypothetical protein n=1 Tax=Chromatium okenii TaxID=61644 RepID=UPI0026ED7364|nr:hypothetical protein [Chromatium okenii]MBV5308461.1 hypothetical protein [Chromatium okenii]